MGELQTLQREESKEGSREGRKALLNNQYIERQRYMWGGPYGVAADARNSSIGDVSDIVDGAVWDTKKYVGFYACEIIIIIII